MSPSPRKISLKFLNDLAYSYWSFVERKVMKSVTVIIDFIRHIRPANDKNLPFHLANLFFILVTTVSKKECFLGLPATIIPKYLNGTFIILQFKAFENLYIAFLSTPRSPILLVRKLALRPELISKHQIILFIVNTF